MTEAQEQEMLANVKSLTDHMRMVDEVFRALKVGRNMALVFRCGHSGLYFRGDFLRGWGRDYGIGLGPDPVSEVLNSDYDIALPALTRDIRDINQIMFPVASTRAQVDALLVDVDAVTAAGEWAVLAKDDPDMYERAGIVRARQIRNPRGGPLLSLETEWRRLKGVLK